MNNEVIKWLLEDNNLAVKYRTQTEILNMSKDSKEVILTYNALLSSDLIKSVMSLFDIGKDFSDSHALSALAEYGLTRKDLDIDSYWEKETKLGARKHGHCLTTNAAKTVDIFWKAL